MAAQSGVDFTVLVEIRGDMPGTVVQVEEEDHAFAYVDEEADLAAASVIVLSVRVLFFFIGKGVIWEKCRERRKGDDALS